MIATPAPDLLPRLLQRLSVQIREYILRRLMIFPLIIVGTSIIVFSLSRVGGNPIAIYIEHEMSAEEVAVTDRAPSAGPVTVVAPRSATVRLLMSLIATEACFTWTIMPPCRRGSAGG